MPITKCSTGAGYVPSVRPVLLILSCCVLIVLNWSCSEKSDPPRGRPPVPVLIAEAVAKDVPVQVTAIGNVEAYSTVTVRSQINGELLKVHFTQGQEVRKGELLFEIDPRPSQADLSRAQANLSRDAAVLQQAEANLARDGALSKNAEAERERFDRLYAKGVAAKEQLDSMRTNAEAAAAAVKADQAAIDNAHEAIKADRAAVETVQLNLGYCSIRSPIDGRTGSLLVNQGNVVKLNDTSLVVINQVHPIYVDFSVPEKELPEIKRHMAAGKLSIEASIPNDPGTAPTGVLSFVDNAVDQATGTIKLRGTFENDDRRLWPGQFVNVVLTLSTQRGAVVVPSQSVQTGQNGTFVFVARPDMTVETRPVKTGRAVDNGTIIEQGIRPGEKVVTDGQLLLVNGAPILVKNSLGGPLGERPKP